MIIKQIRCAICSMGFLDESFQKVIDETGLPTDEPLYWANKQFHSDLDHNVYFCNAYHSLEWYQNKIFDKNA